MTNPYNVDLSTTGPRPRVHGKFCTPECREVSSLCHLGRQKRAPAVGCPHCGALPGFPCVTMTRRHHRLTVAGTSHPSRREAA